MAGKNRPKGATKKEQRQEARRGKTQQKTQKGMLWLLAVAVIVGGGAWFYIRDANLPGQQFDDLGRRHIPEGTPSPKYNSNPPTSGAHAGATRWGEHSVSIPEINQVHNLEHGGILIQYNCAKLPEGQSCGKLRSDLRKAFNKARDEVDIKIILAPYDKLPRPVALTAWRWLQYLDGADEETILAFAAAHINNAPEQVQ